MCVIDTLQELNSDKCSNGNGTFECGKCSCHPGRYGKFCECKADDLTSKDSIKQCTAYVHLITSSYSVYCKCLFFFLFFLKKGGIEEILIKSFFSTQTLHKS